MTSNLTTFYSSVKNIRTELEVFTKSRHALDSAVVQKFLYYSIDYVSSYSELSDDTSLEVELTEWFSLLSQVIYLLFQYRSNGDMGISPQNLISYLSNISYKLLSINQIVLDWHRLIWMAVLQILALYSQDPALGPELLAKVAQMGYKVLRSAGQKAEAKYKIDKHIDVHRCYELYLLGTAITCLDPTRKSGSPLKSAKDLLSVYLQSYKPRSQNSSHAGVTSVECGSQQCLKKLVAMAVTVYTLQSHDVAGDMRLSFYVELFRLVVDDRELREKLLACNGDLFKYDLSQDTDDLPADGTHTIRELNLTVSTTDQSTHNPVHSIVQAVLSFVHQLQVTCENGQDLDEESRKESSLQIEPMQDIESASTSIHSLLKESHGPVSTAVSGCLVVLTHSVPRGKHIRADLLVNAVRLISLSVDAFVRDIFISASRQSHSDLTRCRLNSLGVATTTVMSLLDVLLTRDEIDMDRVIDLADILKSVLKSLHTLAEAASNKKVVFPDLAKHAFTILKRAMSDVGTLGRRLTRLGLYSVAIQLLSPLWPVTKIEELLPSVSHHGSLCESYLKMSQLKEAWSVIRKAVLVDVSLVSDSVINVLVKILKQDTQLCALKLLESCTDEDKCLRLLMLLARKLVSSQSNHAMSHATNILRCLVRHKGLSGTERATHEFLLAQTLWFVAEAKTSVSRECLSLVKTAVKHLLADDSCLFDDILAHAAFLYWGIVATLCHLGQSVHVNSETDCPSPSSSPQVSGNADQTLPVTADVPVSESDMSRLSASAEMESEDVEQVDSDFLMSKSAACLQVWTRWFLSTGNKVLETDGAFRLETSLRFLQRVAEQAIINHQTMTAVTALCRAHQLADMMKRPNVIQDIKRTLISVIPHLGLKCQTYLDTQDSLVDGLKLMQGGDLLGLTAVAAHHLKTGQLPKFVLVRDLAFKIIEESKKKGLRTCSIYTALAILNRLDAEFHSLPAFTRLSVTACSSEPTPNPLELAAESLKNVKNVVTFYLGEDLQSAKNKSSAFEVWQVIHEYLQSLKLYGDLSLHTGNVKYAKTYFNEGYIVASRFHLVTWSAIFSACHVELALACHDTTTEAHELLQSAVNVLKKHKLAADMAELQTFNGNSWMDVVTSHKLSDVFAEADRVPCSCCHSPDWQDADCLRKQLLADWTDSQCSQEETMDAGEEGQILSYTGTCEHCYQPEVAGMFADLMSSQAEILWRNREPLSLVTSSLQSSVCSTPHHMELSLKKCVENTLKECNLCISVLQQDTNINYRLTLDALFRLAEVTFQNLYVREQEQLNDGASIHEVQNLLDIVEREGKKMNGLARSNVLVASALLLKSHLTYLPLLQTSVEEHEDDITSDRKVIVKDIELVKQEIQYWDEQKCSWLTSSVVTAQPNLSPLRSMIKTPSSISSVVSRTERDQEAVSDQNGGQTRVTGSSQRVRNKFRSSSNIEIYTDSEPASIKKSRVALTENSLLQNVYNINNIGVESPECRHSVSRCNSLATSGGDKPRSHKLMEVPKREQIVTESEVGGNVCNLPRSRDQLCEENVQVLNKGDSKTICSRTRRKGPNLSSYILSKENILHKSTAKLLQKCLLEENRSTNTGGDEGRNCTGRQGNVGGEVKDNQTPAGRRRKKKEDNMITPLKDRKARRRKCVVQAPETVRGDCCQLDLCVNTESTFHEQISSTSCSRNFWGSCGEEEATEDVVGEDMIRFSDSVLSHNLQTEALISVVRADGAPENMDINFHSPLEIPRGRPQRKKPEPKMPETSESDSGRKLRGGRRERLVKRSCVRVQSPDLGVVEEKENVAEDVRDLTELVPQIQDVLHGQKCRLLGRKDSGSVPKLSPATVCSRKTGILQELCSPNVAVSTRQRTSRKQVREVVDEACVHSGKKEVLMESDGKASNHADLHIKFPTLTMCQPVTERIKYLQDALKQLDGFPQSILYRQICQSLAFCLWETDMSQVSATETSPEIAAYLAESMQATFQHMMVRNLHCKIRKFPVSDTSLPEASVEKEALRTALSSLTFGGDVMEHFSNRLASLPADWTVGQLTIVAFDPSSPGQGQLFVTRLAPHLQPITVGLPYQRWQLLQTVLRVYEVAIQHKVEGLTAQEHWKCRHQQDQDMQDLVYFLQEIFLGAHKWLLRGQMACVRQPSVQKILDKAAQDTVYSVLQLHCCHVSYGTVRHLMEVLLQANARDIVSLVECVWPSHVAHTVSQAYISVQRELMASCLQPCSEKRQPLVLILDTMLNKIPWESMPDLSSDIVTRVPSLAILFAMLTIQKKQTSSPFQCGVDRTNVVAVIPPDTDLKNAVNFLAPQFQQYAGWTCLIQKAPTVAELKSILTDSCLYLYCGHNWGHQYVGGRDVQMFRGKAVAILMGCGSGKLDYRGKLDGDGGPLYFLLAGCPTVVGNLWLVTDKDIDKLTSALFSHWMSQTKPISLGQLLVSARKVCKLAGLTGFAPVIYGLPVMMN